MFTILTAVLMRSLSNITWCSVSKVTLYTAHSVQRLDTGWTVLGSNSGGGTGWIFCISPDRPWGPLNLLYSGYRVSFPGLNRSWRDADYPPLSSAKDKERVQWSERENQQDATVRCLLSTLSKHVSGIIMPIFRRPRRVLLHVVYCAGSAGCGW